MKHVSELRTFIVAILKKPVSLISFLLGIAALSVQLTLSEFSLPQFYSCGILFLGFAWSAFQVFRDLSLEYQKVIYTQPFEKIPKSNISISFIERNEYRYSISDPYTGQNNNITKMLKNKKVKSHFDERGVFHVNGKIYYCMGKGNLEINIQLQNIGDVSLDVLSMDVDNDLDLNHLLLIPMGIYFAGDNLRFPMHLKKGDLINVQIRYKVSINRGSHEGLFAADLHSLPRLISHEISTETMDENGNNRAYISEFKTSTKPLIDLYVKQWREYGQEEYLILAGYGIKAGRQ
ncbi:MAG TPA: hypothetical protein DCX53_07110 [Anaerolineae bacterium]|nr:hypothetical protein [Anaerolineae bacterium]